MAAVRFTFEEGSPIKSVEHFLGEIKAFAGTLKSQVYFRGDGEPSDSLLPSIGRKHYYLGRPITFDKRSESKLLRQFRRHAYEHFGRIPSDWETLFLARHHGLPTRLLDWTSNPLVALYFAAFYENEELAFSKQRELPGAVKLNLDGAVWAIQQRPASRELDVLTDRRHPLSIRGIKLVHPYNASPRMIAQAGMFTLHENPWMDVVQSAGRRYRAQDLDIYKLIRWPVRSRDKTGIVLDLERLAINSRTLFPDLDGLARGLWQTEVIRAMR
ncbi:MAG TPA: FRG domain-containing protein [Verrucomicrobiae bacterium]|nr:FRG domain-containing protein [Verrucomicrobiae bacterium]